MQASRGSWIYQYRRPGQKNPGQTGLGEVVGATWSEIDGEARTWHVPASCMKGGVEHLVPLSGPALSILERLERTSDLIFPGLHSQSLQYCLRHRGVYWSREKRRWYARIHVASGAINLGY